ncbi:MAG: hypothetical protein E4H27_03235 [Anaerolineales bacterium]|nr:MAG: hypothetical protein E4H27_03235 [Anaerolineales bacterium]
MCPLSPRELGGAIEVETTAYHVLRDNFSKNYPKLKYWRRRKMKTRTQMWTMIAVIALLLSGCGTTPATVPITAPTEIETQPTESVVETKSQLIVAMADEPEGLDGQQIDWETQVHYWISQPLVSFNLELKALVPDLAESWDISEDGKVITWKIPEGYTYANGDPLDAQAVNDAWNRFKEISPYSEDMAPIIEMNVIDETTLEVIHDNPPAFMWANMVTIYGAPWDAAEATLVGDESFGRDPVASGPFTLKEWVEGSYLLLERNENYRTNLPFVENKGPAHLEEVMIRFIPEDLTRISELEAGTVDIITNVPSFEVARLKQDPNYQVYEFPTAGMTYLTINNQRSPFDDVRVRGALAAAMNRDDLVTVLAGTVDPQYSFLAPAQISYSEDMEQYAKSLHPYDVEAAKALLADAGWTDSDKDGFVDKDGQPLIAEMLLPTDDPVADKIGVVIQAQLQAIGIDVSIATYESSYIWDITGEGDFDLAIQRFIWNDPDILIYMVTDQGGNECQYLNPEIEDQFLAARYIMDPDERTAAYEDIQKTLIDDVAYVPLFSRKDYIAARISVKNLVFHGMLYGQLYLNDTIIIEE